VEENNGTPRGDSCITKAFLGYDILKIKVKQDKINFALKDTKGKIVQ
jgi:hypothetical protein